jgi:hypothetical protein
MVMEGEGIGLFKRTHLSDKISSDLYGGPIRGLQCRDPMEFAAFCSGKPQGGPLAT